MNRDEKRKIVEAIEVFVRGFAFTKSLTHPYEVFCFINGVWAMRDAQRPGNKGYRKEEWIGFALEPQRLIDTAVANSRGWHFLGAVTTENDLKPTRDTFRSLGYRLISTEPFFVNDLKRIPRPKCPAKIVRMDSQQLRQSYATEAKMKPMPEQYLAAESPWRQYLALVDNSIVGWVSSIEAGKSNWCSNLVVRPSFRRQGIGSALLAKMLRDDRAAGSAKSVLLSSHTGSLVYPQLGYQQIATLMIFAPLTKRA